MPKKTITLDELADVVVYYLGKRQLQKRPTTLYQLSKRVSLGETTIKAELEKQGVEYVLIPYVDDPKLLNASNIEIAIKTMPESLAARNGFILEDIEKAYQETFGSLEPLEGSELDTEMDAVLNADPYAPYRIDSQQFRAIKHQLISYQELLDHGKRHGYPGRAIQRATGGFRMRYPIAGDLWKPYYYRHKRYFLKDVLNHMDQVFKTYAREKTAIKKMRRRNKRKGFRQHGLTLENL